MNTETWMTHIYLILSLPLFILDSYGEAEFRFVQRCTCKDFIVVWFGDKRKQIWYFRIEQGDNVS